MKTAFTPIIALFVFLLSSCIKDEAMYREADIEVFDLNDSIFVQALPALNSVINVIVSDLEGAENRKFAPTFTLSPKAKSNPCSGDSLAFKDRLANIEVLSEDESLLRKFVIRLVQMVPINTSFEEWTTGGAGILIHPAPADNLWSTANSGIALATMGKIEEYPTRSTEDAHSGKFAAILETKKGGTYWGKKIPIFSGSLFSGKFIINIGNFIKSTKFGQLHPKTMGKPAYFKGFYKYKPGEIFIDENGEEVAGKVDECSIHSIMYRIEKGDTSDASYLTGEDILTSERIIAKAILEDKRPTDVYTEFNVPFVYSEQPDYDKYDYRLAVVFASSKDGDSYRGAIGSTLIVDDVEIVCDYD